MNRQEKLASWQQLKSDAKKLLKGEEPRPSTVVESPKMLKEEISLPIAEEPITEEQPVKPSFGRKPKKTEE